MKVNSVGLKGSLRPIRSSRIRRLFVALLLSISIYGNSYAQITLKSSGTVESILFAIRKQSGYDLFYEAEDLKGIGTINLSLSNASVQEALEKALEGLPLHYRINNKNIIITKGKARSTKEGQSHVRAKILDVNGFPIVGATVRRKNEKTGLGQSDKDGIIDLPVSTIGQNVVIYHMGYKPLELKVEANKGDFVIRLESVESAVEEVVVTGIFSRPTENFTGAATTIKGEDLRKVGVTDIFKNIAAIDPAFNVVANNALGGNINQMPEIQIRGQSSFPTLSDDITTNPNQPLFVLDGFEVNLERIKDLDINLIASVVILKDASATTIYGSRGANGVMVINTLQPEPGKLNVSVANDVSISTPDLSVYSLLNARQKLDFEQRAGIYTHVDPNQQYALSQLYNERLKAVVGGLDTDWRNLPVHTGVNNRTSISIRGGDNNIRYGINAGANFQNGVMRGQDRGNYSGQFDFSYLLRKIRFSNSARFYQTKSNESPYGSFATYLEMNPYWAPYDEAGNVKYYLEEFDAQGGFEYQTLQTNPLYNAKLNSVNRNRLTGFQNNLNIRYDVVPSFFIDSKLSITKEISGSDIFLPGTHTSFDGVTDSSLKGKYTKGQTEKLNYEFATYFNYNKRLDRHLLLGTLSVELGSRQTDGYSFTAVGFPTDNLDHILYATQYAPNAKPSGSESKSNRVGFLLNGNYSYDNRYLADISIRKDGSSLYGTERKFGDFWSAGLGWNIHNESFFKDNGEVNRLRLRTNYGSTGSLEIPAYTALSQYTYNVDNTYNGGLGASLVNIGNPRLGWQEKKELNVGADIEVFNNRLNVRIDYYNAKTNQAITQLSLAPSVGFGSYYENYGKISNKGIELAVQYKLVDRMEKGFNWTVFANGLHNQNKLLEISDNLKLLNSNLNSVSNTVPNFLFEEGKSTTSLFAVQSLGIDPATGKEVYRKKDGSSSYTWTAQDKIAYGNSLPKIQGSFGTNVFYKGFEIGLIVDYRFGGQVYNQTLVDKVENINPYYNVDRRAYDFGWKGPGDVSLYRQIHIANNVRTFTTTRFVQDENTLNVNSLSFGYFFTDQPFIKKLGFSSLRLRAITNDVARFSSVQIERGTENPFARIYSLSINASF